MSLNDSVMVFCTKVKGVVHPTTPDTSGKISNVILKYMIRNVASCLGDYHEIDDNFVHVVYFNSLLTVCRCIFIHSLS